MLKSLQLQAELAEEFGACVFDVTLDCEDGAPVGGEADHAALVTRIALEAGVDARVAVRVHPADHPAFESDMAVIAGQAGHRLTHVMVPKVESLDDVRRAEAALVAASADHLPIHVLIESPAAVHRAFEIAAHPRVQSLSFGLMDFVSAHGGAIPAQAMSSTGQFTHPLVVRAKLEIAAACHAHGKVPSHCVVTELTDSEALRAAATRAEEFYAKFFGLRRGSAPKTRVRSVKAARRDGSEIGLLGNDLLFPVRSRDSCRPAPFIAAIFASAEALERAPHDVAGDEFGGGQVAGQDQAVEAAPLAAEVAGRLGRGFPPA